MFLVDVLYSGIKKENEQILVLAHELSDSGTSSCLEVIVNNIFHHDLFNDGVKQVNLFAVSKPFTDIQAQRYLEHLQGEEKYSDLEFKVEKRENFHVVAEGKAFDLRKLPNYFILVPEKRRGELKRLSKRDLISLQTGFPFRTIEKINETDYQVGPQLTLEEFKRIKAFSFDSEYRHWESPGSIKLEYLSNSEQELRGFLKIVAPNLSGLSHVPGENLVSLVESYFNMNLGSIELDFYKQPMTIQVGEIDGGERIVHYFQYLNGEDSVEKLELENGEVTVKSYKFDSAIEMVKGFQDFFVEEGVVFILSTNGMTYDLLQAREFVEREREIAKARGAPREELSSSFNLYGYEVAIKGKTEIFSKVICPPIMHFDLTVYSKNWLPFTRDNKFPTIMSMLLGRKIEKSQDYADLTRIAIEKIIRRTFGIENNKEVEDSLKKYASEDVSLINEVEDYCKTAGYFKAKLFHASIADICFTSGRGLALRAFEKDRLIDNLQPYTFSREQLIEYEDIVPFHEFLRLGQRRAGMFGRSTKKYFSEESVGLFYIAPFSLIFKEFLNNQPFIREIYDYIDSLNISPDEGSTQSTLFRVDMVNTIENGWLTPYVLTSKINGFNDFPIEVVMHQFFNLIREFRPVNNSNNFFCFKQEDYIKPEFQEAIEGLGFKVAEGSFLNVKKGSFMLYDGVNIFKREIDTKGNLGFKTIYQQELIMDYVDTLFRKGPEEAIDLVMNFISKLKTGNVDRNKLIYFKEKVIRDYFDYSSYAQRQERIRAYIEFGLKKGNQVAYVKLHDRRHKLNDFLRMNDSEVFSPENITFFLSDYLGPELKLGGRALRDGKIGRYIEPLMYNFDLPKNQFCTYLVYNDILGMTGNLSLFD